MPEAYKAATMHVILYTLQLGGQHSIEGCGAGWRVQWAPGSSAGFRRGAGDLSKRQLVCRVEKAQRAAWLVRLQPIRATESHRKSGAPMLACMDMRLGR
jgi:hypothetical protein